MNSIDKIRRNYDDDERYGILPYIAPEVLHDKQYTYYADIYSFGILFYRITLGISPYYNIPYDVDLGVSIQNGLNPEFPNHAPKLFIQMMMQCLDIEPSKRPNAAELKNKLSHWHMDLCEGLKTEINDQCKKYEEGGIGIFDGNSYKVAIDFKRCSSNNQLIPGVYHKEQDIKTISFSDFL
ncbi:2208_t:CDS:2 [Gigaspora margarita]|uniref:mitogen-activated protein kinase kinase n=1 Tax=Gigaspora margarita TaxID=4874 RepID=A0ABM8W2U7_GIGMA|nr:2208_t:CDS:2 [Gigaspora margarita]